MYKSGGNQSRPLLHIVTLTAPLTSQLTCHSANRRKVLIYCAGHMKVSIQAPEMRQDHARPMSIFRRRQPGYRYHREF